MKSLLSALRSGHLRENVESAFGQWGGIVYRRAWWVIALSMLLVVAMASQLKLLEVDVSTEAFFHDDDPSRVYYDEFRAQFGRDDKAIVFVETDDLFTVANLEKLSQLQQALEDEVPYLDRVDSIVSGRSTRGINDQLLVDDFLAELPETQEQAKALRELAMSNPFYVPHYISRDGRMAAFIIKNLVFAQIEDETRLMDGFEDDGFFEEEVTPSVFTLESIDQLEELPPRPKYISGEDSDKIMYAIDSVLERFNTEDFRVSAAAGPYTTSWFLTTFTKGMLTYTGMAIIAVALFLYLIFRRVAMVFLPITVAFLAMICAMSATAMTGVRPSFSMQIVPSFLIAVGVGNSVHIFTVFYQAINRGENKQQALQFAMQHSGLAILMTGLTTAGGLLSFLPSNMKSVAEFGVITPMGVGFALVFSLVLLPALIAVFPVSTKVRQERNDGWVRRLLLACGSYAAIHPRKVLAGVVLLVLISLAAASKLTFSFYLYNNLPADHFIITAMKKIDSNFSGAGPLELVVDSGRAGGVKDPQFLNRLDALEQHLRQWEYGDYQVKNTVSITAVVKELHQALNNNDPDFYSIPQNPELLSQELLLFENAGYEHLEVLVDTEFRLARVTVLGPLVDGIVYASFIDQLLDESQQILGHEYRLTPTGLMEMSAMAFSKMYQSMTLTYLAAFMIITPLMMLLLGSFKVGLVSMVPNLFPIIVTLGVMGQFGIELTGATLLTGSIAMGLVVDDTIHFMHNFQRYFARHGDVQLAIRKTLETAGQAIFFTTIVLSTAFMIFMLNEVKEWAMFGFVTGFCILVALLADMLVAPALMSLLYGKKKS